ncbi:MAG: dynamin family protein [Acidobacteria bacterium]|jgi:GTP-binding protein EngB required for normal cell division|nr:dynamin family protein [Acidobacteriota bacterium]
MSIETIWPDIFGTDVRLAWAYKAHDNFINSFKSERIKDLYKSQKQGGVNVSIFGRSQVGKTTLIIRLIGVDEKYHEKLAKILRGKREQGNSATSTATIYQKSDDDYFYFIENGREALGQDDTQIEICLKDLRNRVECEQYQSTDCILIKIPRKYFITPTEDDLKINIIDLPGVGSKDKREHKHVEAIINKYLPISNLILLVDLADQITYFNSIPISQIQNWRFDPDRFRIILTRSVSNHSTQEKIRERQLLDKNYFRQIFIDEFGKELPVGFKIYPLEYGDSWNSMSSHSRELKNKTEPIVNSLIDELIKDINITSSPYQQLISETRRYTVIKKIIDETIEDYKKKMDVHFKEKTKCLTYKNELEGAIDKYTQIKKDIENKFLNMKSIDGFSFNFKGFAGEITVSNLKNYLSSFFWEITRQANRYIFDYNSKYKAKLPENFGFMEICQKESREIQRRLDDYFLDDYFSNKCYIDRNDCEKTCHTIIKVIEEKIDSALKESLKKYNDEIIKEIRGIEEKQALYKDNLEKAKKQEMECDKEISKLEHELNNEKVLCENDMEIAKRFFTYIQEGFEQEKEIIWQKVVAAQSPEEKMLQFCSFSLLFEEFSKLNSNYKMEEYQA